VKNNVRSNRVAVSSDGKGLLSQAGSVLLWETIRVTGMGRGLSQGLERWRAPRAVHDPGKIIADLAAAVALGGDCLADIAILREQPDLASPVASDPVVSRLVTALAADEKRALKAIRSARAAARERAWALAGQDAPGSDGDLVTIDLDATIVIAHSQGTGLSHLEEDLWLPSHDRLRRSWRRRERGAAGHRAAGRECGLQHRRRPH
jgi:Transposase DDE domain group 1